MRCPFCGAKNVEGVTLCQKCGVTLKYLEEPLSLGASTLVDVGIEEDGREERSENNRENRRNHTNTN